MSRCAIRLLNKLAHAHITGCAYGHCHCLAGGDCLASKYRRSRTQPPFAVSPVTGVWFATMTMCKTSVTAHSTGSGHVKQRRCRTRAQPLLADQARLDEKNTVKHDNQGGSEEQL